MQTLEAPAHLLPLKHCVAWIRPLMRHICSPKCAGEAPFPGCQGWWWPQHLSLRMPVLSQALIPELQGWQVTGARAPWSVTRNSWRIWRTPLLLSPIDSATSHYCQSGQHHLHRGRGASRRLPGQWGAKRSVQHACKLLRQCKRGGGCFSRGCPGSMPRLKRRPFALQHTVHTIEKHRRVKPLEQFSVEKRSSWGSGWNVSQGCQWGKQCFSLRCDCLVRKMT